MLDLVVEVRAVGPHRLEGEFVGHEFVLVERARRGVRVVEDPRPGCVAGRCAGYAEGADAGVVPSGCQECVLGDPRLGVGVLDTVVVVMVSAGEQDARHAHDPHGGFLVAAGPCRCNQPVEAEDVGRTGIGEGRLQLSCCPGEAFVISLLSPESKSGEAGERTLVDDVEDRNSVWPHVEIARGFGGWRRGLAAMALHPIAAVGRHAVLNH